jgi:uncharacterized protein (DUF2252 family)
MQGVVRAMTDKPTNETNPTVVERKQLGREARKRVPRSSHADWEPNPYRRGSVDVLSTQNTDRVPWLVPLRHTRMGVSPFTFYRGAAAVMAEDLSDTPNTGFTVQAGGDAHLSNFGAYASPERKLVFDANDFDETLPGPWEWDLKRLCASLVIAASNLGMSSQEGREVAMRASEAYREAIRDSAKKRVMDLWYEHVTLRELKASTLLPAEEARMRVKRFTKAARKKDSLQALRKLSVRDSGSLRIRSIPPLLWPLRELPSEYDGATMETKAREAYESYVESTPDHLRSLLSRFDVVDVALKVVGVGSVGTRCFIMLLQGRDDKDPLFLQFKEAGPSVLEDYLVPSVYDHQGQRVVEGQKLVQAQFDIFLGWTTGMQDRQFYVRQLRDWKGSVNVDSGTWRQLLFYADLCGRTMARGHARSGDPVAMAGYMGKSDTLDKAIAEFAVRYANVNQQDYDEFQQAVADGVLLAEGAPK